MQLYFTMPKPGETIREGSIVKWLKNPTDFLDEKDPLVELETEKAVFTAESPFRGILKEILVKENEEVKVGTPLALFDVSEEDGEKYVMLGVGMPVQENVDVGAPLGAPKNEEISQKKGAASSTPTIYRGNYSPFIRKLAKENHLTEKELEKIPRKRTGERLTKEDLLEYLKKSPSPQPSPTRGEGGIQRDYKQIPLSPIRHRIAEHLTKSHHEIPQAATSVDVDLTEIMKFRKKKNLKFIPTPFYFFTYAVRETLKKFPLFNSSYFEEGGKAFIQQHKNIHLSFAIATKQGLLNPVVQQAENLSFKKLASSILELEKKAREGKLSINELTGGTFLVNNPGAIGGTRSYQLIPYPLVAIIGLNRIQKKPWIVKNKIVPREIAAVDLSFDHRVLDGANAIQFAEEVKRMMEDFPYETVLA